MVYRALRAARRPRDVAVVRHSAAVPPPHHRHRLRNRACHAKT